MSPLFRPKHNTLAQISLFVIAAGAVGVPGGLMLYARTPYARGMQDPVEQPLQFDHRHHTRDEGIDCRYCHNTVDKSPSASIPPTQLCLNCHSQVWNKSPLLEPVRVSCHGRGDKMSAVEQAEPLTMGFCLDCHRHPEQNLRPVSEVVNMHWKPEG